MTGAYSVHTIYEGHEIMFHVSTLLPYSKDNKQQVSDVWRAVHGKGKQAASFNRRGHALTMQFSIAPCSDGGFSFKKEIYQVEGWQQRRKGHWLDREM